MGSIAVGSACGLIDNGADAACRFDTARLEAQDDHREISPAPLPTQSELDAVLQSSDENARKFARGVASLLKVEYAVEDMKVEDAKKQGEGKRLNSWDDQKIEASFRATLSAQPLLRASAPEPAFKIQDIPGPRRDPKEPRLVSMFDRESDKLDKRDDYTEAGINLVRSLCGNTEAAPARTALDAREERNQEDEPLPSQASTTSRRTTMLAFKLSEMASLVFSRKNGRARS